MPKSLTRSRNFSPRSAWTAVTLAAAVTAGTGAVWLQTDPMNDTTAAAAISPVAATGDVSDTSAESDTGAESDTELIQQQLQKLVDAGYPSVSAAVTDPKGNTTAVSVGTGNLATGEAPPVDGQVRIGSNTKMFVSTVVMQLVDEGAIGLDESVNSYLPGLVEGQGIDGDTITVRQLLQHTAGLPEYADELAADAFGIQHTYISPRDMLDVALEKPAVFAPGQKWEYSNTNYLTEMQHAVPAGDELYPDATYGLGLQSFPLSDGGTAWGHGGDIPGTQTRNAVGPDGTAVTIAVTALPWAIVDLADEEKLLEKYRIVVDALDAILGAAE